MKDESKMVKAFRYLCLSFVIVIGLVAIIGTGGGGDGGSVPGVPPSNSTITGSAVKGPVEGAEVHVFHFDESGDEVEICPDGVVDCSTDPPDTWPVLTGPAGSFSFPIEGTDLMGITSPLIVRTEGGTMYGYDPAPTLEAVIADPQPLTFARVTISCPLSAASSVAAGLLRKLVQYLGSTPTLDDAQRIITQVEGQLKVDLSEDPSDSRTKTAMLNESIDQNLDLPNTPDNNPAVSDFINYLVANLSSSSGLLDDTMDDPINPGTEIQATFTPFGTGTGKLASLFTNGPQDFILMTLTSDVTYVENDGRDTANVIATLTDAAGRPYQDLGAVQLGLVSGPGTLMSAGLSYARGQVIGELTSDTTGDTGDILIRTIYLLSNGNDISLEILVKALDFHVDEDGDGLSDGDEELERTIFVDVAGFGLTAFADKLVKYEDVTSDPKLTDTDGDGLDDHTEYLLKTHPRMVDTDGDGLTDAEEVNRWQTNPLTVDTDFDAGGLDSRSPNPELFDGNELDIYRTSPSLQDTDGDGRTEFEEIFLLNRNPLVSDLPKLELEIVDAVDVRLDVTYAEEEGETYQYGSEMMKSTTRSTSSYSEHSIDVSIEQEVKFSAFEWGATSITFGAGRKWSTTTENSKTTQETYSEYNTDSRTRTETAASGSMTAGIRLRNPGDIAYTLLKLGIAVRHWEQTWDEDRQQLVKSFKTVATLVPALGDGFTLAPGEETPVLQVEATDLNTDRVKELLRRPDSLYLEDEYFELENAEGLNYAFLKEINLTRTASVLIDPGQGNAEEYRVATNVQRGTGGTYSGVTIGEILSDILNVDFATIGRQSLDPASPTNERVLFRIRNVETNLAEPDQGFWTVVLLSEDPPVGLYDFEKIPVKAGDRVLLVFVRDRDGDGVNDLIEQNSATHEDEGSDYDGDGLSDYNEVFVGWQVEWTDAKGELRAYDVVSDPASADQDADGLNDLGESIEGTNPSNPDTDQDGIPDGDDLFPLTQAKVLYVDKNATGAECSIACNYPGECWECAYTDLQVALSAAQDGYDDTPGDGTDDVAEIWVADGVYKPDSCGQTNPIYCSFILVNAVGVYGGFQGIENDYPGEIKRSQRNRNPRINGTVLSGDLNNNDAVWPADYVDNTCHIVVAGSGIDKPTALNGFIITGGNAPSTQPNGGGLMLQGPGVKLRNLFFYDNHSQSGGGAMRVKTNGATISNCIFSENHCVGENGGAIYVENYRDVSIEDCLFRGNSAAPTLNAAKGGAIFAGYHTRLTIKNTDLLGNTVTVPTQYYTEGGGAWIGDNSIVLIENSRFIGNTARYRGGGLYVDVQSDLQVVQSLFDGNKTISYYNYSGGGGIFSYDDGRVAIVNSTIINNSTYPAGGGTNDAWEPYGGGVRLGADVLLRVDNSIFWGNRDSSTNNTYLRNQIEGPHRGMWTINTSCIEFYNNYYTKISGYGNIWTDPNLSATGTPESGSPFIDRGNTFIDFEPLTFGFQTLPETDLAGESRLADGDDDGIADVDMGAYEYQP